MLCINYGRRNMTFNDFRSQTNRWFDDDVYAFTVIMPYLVFCDVRNNNKQITLFGSSLPSVVLFTLFMFVCA